MPRKTARSHGPEKSVRSGRVSKSRTRAKDVLSSSTPAQPVTTSPSLQSNQPHQDQQSRDPSQVIAHHNDKESIGDRQADAASSSQMPVGDTRGSADPPVTATTASRQPESSEIKPVPAKDMGPRKWIERGNRRDPWWDPDLEDAEENKRWANQYIFGGQIETNVEQEAWKDTGLSVDSFVDACFPRAASWDSLDADRQRRIKAWAAKAEKFISVPDIGGASSLFRAWVWRILCENLFSADCEDKWNGEYWAAFGKTSRSLQERVTTEDNLLNHSYHSWRCQSVHLLYMRHGLHSDPKRLENILREELAPILRLRGRWDESMSEVISKMVRDAIKLDLCILAARPNMVVEMHDPQTRRTWGFPCRDPSGEMEVDMPINSFREPNGHPVDFITTPLLRIFGEMDVPAPDRVFSNSHRINVSWRRYDLCLSVKPMTVQVDQFPDDPAEGE